MGLIADGAHALSHAQWLWLMVGLQLVLFSLGWWAASRFTADAQPMLRHIAIFNAAAGVGLCLVGLRGLAPYLITHAGSNLLQLGALLVLWRVASDLIGRQSVGREPWLVAALGTVLILWFGRQPEQGQMRVLAFYLLVAWVAVRAAWQMFAHLRGEHLRNSAMVLLGTGGLFAAMLTVRALTGLLTDEVVEVNHDTKPALAMAFAVLAAAFSVNLVMANVAYGRMLVQLNHLARHDTLTGLYNRRVLMDEMHQAMARYLLGGPSFSVACVDIDLFKSVNDGHGHAAGDAVLVAVADRLRAQLQPGDAVGRCSAAEFWVLMANSSMENGLVAAERLRAAVAAVPGVHPDPKRAVTASIGVSTVQIVDAKVETVIARADAALYRAKALGRNRVCCDQAAMRSAPDAAMRT